MWRLDHLQSSWLVIIGDLNPVRVSILPDEAEAIAIVDPNAVLSRAVTFQCFQGIAWRTEIAKRSGRVKLKQLSDRSLFNGLKLPGSDSKKYILCFGVLKGPDHVLSYIDSR
jgi:hypothetical protein